MPKDVADELAEIKTLLVQVKAIGIALIVVAAGLFGIASFIDIPQAVRGALKTQAAQESLNRITAMEHDAQLSNAELKALRGKFERNCQRAAEILFAMTRGDIKARSLEIQRICVTDQSGAVWVALDSDSLRFSDPKHHGDVSMRMGVSGTPFISLADRQTGAYATWGVPQFTSLQVR